MAKQRGGSEVENDLGRPADYKGRRSDEYLSQVRSRLRVLQDSDARQRVDKVLAKRGQLTTPIVVPDTY